MKSHTEIFRLKAEATGRGRRRSWLPASAGRTATLAMAALALVGAAGCRQDMHNQPKYRPLRGTAFFADGSSSRPLVEGTVRARHAAGERRVLHRQDAATRRCASCRSRWTRRC